jgi:hypothetical protein
LSLTFLPIGKSLLANVSSEARNLVKLRRSTVARGLYLRQVHERQLPIRRTELTEAQCDLIARIGTIEIEIGDLRGACKTAYLDAPEVIA